MSANRDKSQKIQYVHSNLYRIHAPQNDANEKKPAKLGMSSIVIKAEDLNHPKQGPIRVNPYIPVQVDGKGHPPSPKATPKPPPAPRIKSPEAVAVMEKNLKNLNELQARFRFVLKELEDLVHE